jgi:hypothetical protein
MGRLRAVLVNSLVALSLDTRGESRGRRHLSAEVLTVREKLEALVGRFRLLPFAHSEGIAPGLALRERLEQIFEANDASVAGTARALDCFSRHLASFLEDQLAREETTGGPAPSEATGQARSALTADGQADELWRGAREVSLAAGIFCDEMYIQLYSPDIGA